jgi:glycosyltransferase involved in cell wall biosynthesis
MNRGRNHVIMMLAKSYQLDTRTRNEAETLTQAGYQVTVISWDRFGQGSGDRIVKGVRNISLSLLNGLNFSGFAYAISAIILNLYSVFWCLRNAPGRYFVHANDFNTLLAGVFLRVALPQRVRLVYDCREFTPSAYTQWYGLGFGLIAGEFEKKMLRFVDAIITVSSPIRDYLREFTRAPIILVYNTIRIDSIPHEDKEFWKSRLGLSGVVVSYVGMLRKDVALDELIDAIFKVRNLAIRGVKLVIVGYGPDLERIRAKAAGVSDYVTFVPMVSHVEALRFVKASDISYAVYRNLRNDKASQEYNYLVGVNSNIALPWKVFEAMGCGCCVLVRGGTDTWAFTHGLGFGISAGEGTPEEIAKSLIWAVQNPREMQAMAEVAKKRFMEGYDWGTSGKRLVDAYNSLAI